MSALEHLTDKYFQALHSPLSSYMPHSTERDKFELASMSDTPTLLDFVSNTPSPVTNLLVDYHGVILKLKRFAFAASWTGPTDESFLLLFAWWAACLYGEIAVRYFFPLLLFLGPLAIPFIPAKFRSKQIDATTEEKLVDSLSALDAIYTLRPTFQLEEWQPNMNPKERIRLLGILIIPWLALTFWVPTRILVAAAGTGILIYRAPWTTTTGRILSRSAYMRAAWRYMLGWMTGARSLPLSFPKPSSSTFPETPKEKETKRHEFLFTVLENQRWWVGIDWTAALLPSERPSWCAPTPIPTTASTPSAITSAHSSIQPSQAQFVPLPPPASFPLPLPTSAVLPSSKGDGKYVRKTAKWTWGDAEWHVVVRKEGETLKTVRQEASQGEESKTASKGKNSSPTTNAFQDGGGGIGNTVVGEVEFTDQDGWIYGDNKWENLSAKAGMGKFTRFRRWCRVAVLEEEEEEVDEVHPRPAFTLLEVPKDKIDVSGEEKPPSEGNEQDKAPLTTSETKAEVKRTVAEAKPPTLSRAESSPERGRDKRKDSTVPSIASTSGDGRLQQRLKAALRSSS